MANANGIFIPYPGPTFSINNAGAGEVVTTGDVLAASNPPTWIGRDGGSDFVAVAPAQSSGVTVFVNWGVGAPSITTNGVPITGPLNSLGIGLLVLPFTSDWSKPTFNFRAYFSGATGIYLIRGYLA